MRTKRTTRPPPSSSSSSSEVDDKSPSKTDKDQSGSDDSPSTKPEEPCSEETETRSKTKQDDSSSTKPEEPSNDKAAISSKTDKNDSDSAKPDEPSSKDVPATNGIVKTEAQNGDKGTGDEDDAATEKASEKPPEPKKMLRLVSIEKLMRPSLLSSELAKPTNQQRQTEKPTKRSKDTSVIEISDSDEENQPSAKKSKSQNSSVQHISSDDSEDEIIKIKRKPTRQAKAVVAKVLLEDIDDDEPVAKTKKKPVTKDKQLPSKKIPHGCKEVYVKVNKLPSDLKSLMKEHNIETILDRRNREIVEYKSNSNFFGVLGNRGRAKGAEASKSKANDRNKKSNNSKTLVSSESDSDEPIASIISKSDNIPKNTMSKRPTRAKRQLSESDDDENSDDDFDASPKTKATNSRQQRLANRKAKVAKDSSDDDDGGGGNSDKKDDSDDFEEEEPQPKKKRSRIKRNSSSSSDDGSGKDKKRRKRIKKNSDTDDEDESPNKGRKNIRKVLKKSALEQTTKEAEQEERERKQRIAERQKLYNQVYDEKPEEVKELTQLVLDFDEETKEPLLEVDKLLVKKLKPHQANGIKFMFDACFESLERARNSKGSGCILAHCMGLGKTLQVVTLVHTLLSNSETTGVERVLVVCPLSTVLNWVNEFRIWMKHVKKGTAVEVYEISKYKNNIIRANQLMEWHNEGGVMILGYDMFRNLSNQTTGRIKKKVRESLQTSLISPGPEMIICDEGHLLKNEKTSLSKAVNRINTLRRIVLTGTPIQNNMKEYYCMVQFVKPKLLGTYNEYMNRFVNPITNGQYTDSTPYDIQLMRRRAHVLHKLLDGCVQRRDYSVLAPFLPHKLEFVVSIKLTPLQTTLYKHYMENLARRQGEDCKRSSMLFADFQNLQRIWTHPRVLRYNSDRYEYMQKKKRDMESEAEESEGSIKDFLDDGDSEAETTPSETSSSESDSDGSGSDASHKKKKSKKNKKNDKNSANSDATAAAAASMRRTRNNPDAEGDSVEEVEEKVDNPTEWWMSMCPEEELDNLEHSGKLQVLFEILRECENIGDKLLVFSQSLYSLDVIEHFLALVDDNTQKDEDERDAILDKFRGSWTLGLDYFRLDGSTTIENRNSACKIFNDEKNPRARLFLISTRAGGLGINLVAANRVIIFDVSWNPSHDIQSIFRVYRFGQNKPCYVYRFLAMGTMEEKIYERQVTKQAISKRVIDEQQIDRHYKENDLQELYRYDNIDPQEPRPMPNLPKDRLFAELLKKFDTLLYKYHEHDSLLENKEEETLNEEERKAAWEEFEQEKNRPPVINYGTSAFGGLSMGMGMGMRANGPVTSSNIFGFRNDVLLKLLNMKARQDNPTFNDVNIGAMIPFLMQELCRQMKDGDLSMYKSLLELYYQLEAPSFAPAMGMYNQMMMQPQPQMQQQMPRQVMMGGNAPVYDMAQVRYLREQEQLQYAQLAEPGGSGINRGTIISEAQKRFMDNPVEIVELD
ncbi:transcriptional regulator ATRX homolog isoform X2 [Topomyia yanbarensis]|uniref:transcriptional regulator ATRX homolog isoform X2 n=1 Tax=Topomyia yanbarensis TaxID=2498891 RepID=UPI00273CCB73|nr:transcriptional regulator ATRX homolog isoform X2 [Topomyia yanbarensis]